MKKLLELRLTIRSKYIRRFNRDAVIVFRMMSHHFGDSTDKLITDDPLMFVETMDINVVRRYRGSDYDGIHNRAYIHFHMIGKDRHSFMKVKQRKSLEI